MTPDADFMLETSGLTKRYAGADRPALRDVELSVGRGEVCGVVGESGSGKTTLLRLVAGLEVPTAGAVRVAGRTVADDHAWTPPEERPLGMVFQDGALFPHLTVAENVEFGLRGLPRGERRRRRREVLELVGLEDHAERHPHQLSGGERRRAALARALAPAPELLLLDEPFTGLDENLTARLREEVARILRETGITALLVLHDTDQVLPVADRIAVLREGRLCQVGRPQEVYARPVSAYVARLFGAANIVRAGPRGDGVLTPVGFLPHCRCRDGGGARVCFRPEDFEVAAADDADGVPATVLEAGYRGDRLEARVRVGADGEAGCTLVVHVPSDRALDAGQRVVLRPRGGAGHVLDGGADEGAGG